MKTETKIRYCEAPADGTNPFYGAMCCRQATHYCDGKIRFGKNGPVRRYYYCTRHVTAPVYECFPLGQAESPR